jgi:hypothetical protein
MRWIQILLLVIVLELGVIAARLPEPTVRASGATPVCITDGSTSCYPSRDGTSSAPFYVQVAR